MAQSIENSLLEAIKKDDIKAFGAMMEKAQCGAYRLGRFPTLSLMYLYKSRKLISEYEERFLAITSYNELSEPIEISNKFSAKAGKCLRRYLNEIVSPLEMLLILDNTRRLKRVYPLAKNVSAGVKWRLNSIYYIKYSLSVKFEGNDIIIEKRPLNYREKKRIATLCISVVLAILIFVGVPVTTVSLIPKPIEGEVTKLNQIDFASDKTYTLKNDIILPENYVVEKVNCTLVGNGKKLIFGKGAKFQTFNGKMTGMTIESNGEPIINTLAQNASIDDVTVNINAYITATENTSLFALTNYGVIKNTTLNVSGKIKAVAASEDTQEVTVGAIAQANVYSKFDQNTQTFSDGLIENCAVNYSQFVLEGEASANAAFGGVVGVNNGCVKNCSIAGDITSNTFDIAGVCVVNNVLLSGDVNEANLTQTSSDTGWNPITCGIVLTNARDVENCSNSGKISSTSTCGQVDGEHEAIVSAVGIAYLNRSSSQYFTPYLLGCSNTGDVESSAEHRGAYAAGICISSSGGIENGKNGGKITAKSQNGMDVYVGGITALAYAYIYQSINEGAVIATGSGDAYVGGISAHCLAPFTRCLSSGEITAVAKTVYAGGIFGYGEVARSSISSSYFGSADNCVSQSALNVTASEGGSAYVGGIAGYVPEAETDGGNYIGYFTDCYFVGELKSDVTYFGGIVGVFGSNIFESDSYVSGSSEYSRFAGNYYLNNYQKAFGATITGEDSFANAQDKGATAATIDEIRELDAYKNILKIFN
ncbi:MAG: hypothetical protein K2G37_00580 [Clostridia bacterium]|nr:hypothetical protein [Clostridia bacterium]MDE7328155.1 hypothetical protein [Clostridia bacterium]